MITKNPMQLKAFIKNKAAEKHISAQLVMQNYMLERLLERISLSPYKNNFILKGGFLISAIVGLDTRATMDLDTTIKGFTLTHEAIRKIFTDICDVQIADDVQFEVVGISDIRETDDYPGIRVGLKANYPPISVPLTVDVTTGDMITPREVEYTFSMLFDDRQISILAYNLETVLAEKLETVLSRNIANSELNAKKDAAESGLKKIDAEIETKNQAIREVFDQYFPNTAYYDNFVNELRESRSKYQALIEEAGEMTAKREALHKKIESCRAQIVPVLHKYYPVELPSDLREGIRKLSSEVRDYRELTAKKQAMLKGNAEYQARADELTEEICGILLSYSALDQNLQYDSCLRNLRKRFDGYREAMERLARYTRDFESASSQKAQANESLEQFLMKYQLQEDTSESLIDSVDKDIHKRDSAKHALAEAQNKLTTFLEENPGIENDVADTNMDIPDPEDLQKSEKDLQEQMDNIDTELRNLRQERDRIRRAVENIPAWEDRMARLKSEKEEAEKKLAIAEKAMDFLSRAKDNLANSYVGKVERGFKYYADTLMGNDLGNVMVDRNLHLHIDEKGAAREVGSFSAGTIDCIVLCMRLALVDALFGDEKPFLILDDPFVNLDDKHMERAREMLDKIAQDHQVVYLVCNTSRQ